MSTDRRREQLTELPDLMNMLSKEALEEFQQIPSSASSTSHRPKRKDKENNKDKLMVVSSKWLTSWRSKMKMLNTKLEGQKKTGQGDGLIDAVALAKLAANMGENLTCHHGKRALGVKTVHLPYLLWRRLRAFLTFPADDEADEMFQLELEGCEECKKDQESDNQRSKDHQSTFKTQKSKATNAYKLNYDKPNFPSDKPPLPGDYRLLPMEWQREWKRWLDRNSETPPPAIDLGFLLCDHNKLLYQPKPTLGTARCMNRSLPLGLVAVVSIKEWAYLAETFGVKPDSPGTEGIKYTVKEAQKKGLGSAWEAHEVETVPEVCDVCISVRLETENQAASNFSDAKFQIEQVTNAKEASLRALDGSATGGRTRRAPKNSRNSHIVLGMDSSHNIQFLKLKICEVSHHQPGHMELFLHGSRLADHQTMSQAHIKMNDIIYMQLDETKVGEVLPMIPQGPETGFAGSFLSSAPAPPAARPQDTFDPTVKLEPSSANEK
eukprot:gb/GEZN01003408.1/.p1 GENE.gb/GEZN01003408.1/~~gb/GEZN01003408.1/.p1  ORF type:complete len:574 (-),score=132.86 gb/GEZN01003408.1/:463-1941(-)